MHCSRVRLQCSRKYEDIINDGALQYWASTVPTTLLTNENGDGLERDGFHKPFKLWSWITVAFVRLLISLLDLFRASIAGRLSRQISMISTSIVFNTFSILRTSVKVKKMKLMKPYEASLVWHFPSSVENQLHEFWQECSWSYLISDSIIF